MMAGNELVVPLGVTARIICCIIVVAVLVLVLVCLGRLVTLLALIALATLVVRLSCVLVDESLVYSSSN
jgi:hypothetical protein